MKAASKVCHEGMRNITLFLDPMIPLVAESIFCETRSKEWERARDTISDFSI